MKYYKIQIDSKYIGVGTTADFRRYQQKHDIILISDEDRVQYIQHNDKLYHDTWMRTIIENRFKYKYANVNEIDEEEYLILKNAEDNNEEVPTIKEPKKIEEPEEYIDINQLDYVKEAKINKLRADCQNAIIGGFDLELSDGVHHFSMEITDQMEISRLISNGDNGEIPYHSDGEKFRYFSFNEILKIYNAMNDWRLYNTSYFSDLKSYVDSLRSIKKIDNIKYGDEIPEKYQSEVYKDIKDKMDF